jgi:hypothetical protein
LTLGAISALYSAEEISYEEKTVGTWDSIASSSLTPPTEPHNSTFWSVLMQGGSWFEMDLFFSGSLRVTVYAMKSATQTLTPIFDQSGVAFNQKVSILEPGSYDIEIRNEGSTVVEILPGSTVAAKQIEAKKHASYPYQALGVLAISFGLIILLLGVFIKSKTKRLRGYSQTGRRGMASAHFVQ